MASRRGAIRNSPVLITVGHLLFLAVGALVFVDSVYYVATLNNQILLVLGAATAVAAVLVLIRVGQHYEWTGFGRVVEPNPDDQEIQPRKTLWDWLQLLIVPLVLAGIGLVFSMQQDVRQQQIEDQRAQDAALQAYLDQMSLLILQRNLLESEDGDPVYTLAQARTTTVILRLDSEHNRDVTRFLSDSGLAGSDEASVGLLKEIVLKDADLSDANLQDANLSGANLQNANLSGANLRNANLSGANLQDANLRNASLQDANLSDAELFKTGLNSANLFRADLNNADLQSADLSNAYLGSADLSDASLWYADLSDAELYGADLSDAGLADAEGITNEELHQQAASLEGATLPDGQWYEEWRNSRGE